ncbi:pancreas/duodenum homeobox protein 1 [candidate division KSB3 bacterium]|uniref:Pancreas/duodenum homeobox protein 1 n=1 Tax=candidate division KSB3 bacterium TaxID=2044937 RepID=A0A2G6EAX8_9BACT|nr:MAG: pancreas/duodenum homeobox protein 1 [candidate division KSB3 bacterium]
MALSTDKCETIFDKEQLSTIFPPSTSNEFFDALLGDASEGAYDIELGFRSVTGDRLTMEFRLHQRPGCCLACNLTQGLPQVFSRHPVIDAAGVVKKIDALLAEEASCKEWSLGATEQRSEALHIVPLFIELA